MTIGLNKSELIGYSKSDPFWHWRRVVSLVVLITFSSSVFSPVFASYEPFDERSNKEVNSSKGKAAEAEAINISDDSISVSGNNNVYANYGNNGYSGQNKIKYYPKNYPERSESKSLLGSIKYKVAENRDEHVSLSIKSDKFKNNSFSPFLSKENKYKPYLEIGGIKYFNQKSTVAGVYDLFIPLLQADDRLIFTDLRVFDRSGGSFEGNAHLGFRRLYLEDKKMFGVYASFDRRRSEHRKWFNQIMLGVEWWQDKWFLGGNLYRPIGKTRKLAKRAVKVLNNVVKNNYQVSRSISFVEDTHTDKSISVSEYYEDSLPGLDGEVGYSFTDNLTAYIGGYYFHKEEAKTVAGPKLRLTYNYNKPHGRILGVLDGIGIETGIQHDKPRGTTAYIGIRVKVGLTSLDKNSNIFGFDRHMTELVRRDPDIIISQAPPKETIYKFQQPGSSGFQGGRKNNESEGNEKNSHCKGFGCLSDKKLLSILGLSKNATPEDIESRYKEIHNQYRRESKIHHPDQGGTNEKQTELNNVYSAKKAVYDELKIRGLVGTSPNPDIQSYAQPEAKVNTQQRTLQCGFKINGLCALDYYPKDKDEPPEPFIPPIKLSNPSSFGSDSNIKNNQNHVQTETDIQGEIKTGTEQLDVKDIDGGEEIKSQFSPLMVAEISDGTNSFSPIMPPTTPNILMWQKEEYCWEVDNKIKSDVAPIKFENNGDIHSSYSLDFSPYTSEFIWSSNNIPMIGINDVRADQKQKIEYWNRFYQDENKKAENAGEHNHKRKKNSIYIFAQGLREAFSSRPNSTTGGYEKDRLDGDNIQSYFLTAVENVTLFENLILEPWFVDNGGVGKRGPPCCLFYEQPFKASKEQDYFWRGNDFLSQKQSQRGLLVGRFASRLNNLDDPVLVPSINIGTVAADGAPHPSLKEATESITKHSALDVITNVATTVINALDYVVDQLIDLLVPIKRVGAKEVFVNNLIEFEKRLDTRNYVIINVNETCFIDNNSNKEEFDFCNVENQLVLINVVKDASEILDKTGKLDYVFIKKIFDIYTQILTVYPLDHDRYSDDFATNFFCCDPSKECFEVLEEEARKLVIDILAEDKHFSETKNLIFEQLNPLAKAISYEKDKKSALFIALRLVQNHIYLPTTTLKQFIGFLYDEDESVSILAVKLYYQINVNNEIPGIIRDEIFDALILLLPKAGYPQNYYVNSILDGFTLNHIQQERLKVQRKIARWYATTSQREKISLVKQLYDELSILSEKELTSFAKDLELTQNSELITIAKNLAKKSKPTSLSHEEALCEPMNLFHQPVSPFHRRDDKEAEILNIDQEKIEVVTSGGASLLLDPSQWEQLQKQIHQIEGPIKRIGFTDFRTFNEVLTFVRKNKLDGEILSTAINFASLAEMHSFASEFEKGSNKENWEDLANIWILDDVSIFYGELLGSLIEVIKKEYELSPSDANALYVSIESLLDPENLNWPAKFLFGLLKNSLKNNPANIPVLITALEIISDYKISPKMVDRNGKTTTEILEKTSVEQLLSRINRLVRDNHFYVSKNMGQLIKELKKLNSNSVLMQKFIDDFVELFPKIEDLLYGQIKMQNEKLLRDWEPKDFQEWRKTILHVNDGNLAEVMAILSQAAHNTIFENNFYPRTVQLFALMLLVKSTQGCLVQVSTGEGKSIINAMFAVIKAIEGHQIDVITTSEDLAQRDALEYKNFYGLFDISADSNVDDNYRGGEKPCYKSDAVYGNIMGFNGDTLRDITEDVKLGRGFDILIVDEVDSLFVDQNSMKIQLLSSGASGFDLLNPLFVYMFGVGTIFGTQLLSDSSGCYFKKPLLNEGQAENINTLKLEEIENGAPSIEPVKIGENCLDVIRGNLTDYTKKNLFAFEQIREARAYVVPSHLRIFVEDQLPNWIESFFRAYEHAFKIDYIISTPDEEDARYKFSDITVVEPSTGIIIQRLQWGDGLHQFLEVKHRITMLPENVVATFMSYYGYFNKYKGRIYGVTGTLGNDIHHEFLENMYGVKIYIVPTFVKKDITKFPTIFAISKENWMDEIIAAIYRVILNRQRAGLIVTETIEDAENIRDRLIARKYNQSQIFTYGIGGKNEKKIFEDKLKPGDIIVATNLGGRGVDVKINREVQRNGGLHLIVAGYSANIRTGDQVDGRPARKGEPGSKQLILNVEKLDPKCFEEKNIIDCLDRKRNKQEKKKLENDKLILLPNLRFLDELFEMFVELIKEADSPTRYKLIIGKHKDGDTLQPVSFYLYEEKERIRIKIIDDKELVDLDITDSIVTIDPQAHRHLKTVLSGANHAASSLNGQDREVINFIATINGYTKISSIYEHVKYEFNLAETKGEENRSYFKFLFSWEDDKINKYLQENSEIRKKYWLWLAVRKLYNNEFEIKQITEEWGIWLKKRWRYVERLGRNISDIEKEEIRKEFTVFKQEIVERIENKDKIQFIKNPSYLTLKSWRYLQIYYNQLMSSNQGMLHASAFASSTGSNSKQGWLSYIYSLGKSFWESLKSRIGFGEENYNPPDPLGSAVGFLEEAARLDDVYSWIPYNALSYMRLLKDGRGITEETQAQEANSVKNRFIEDLSNAVYRIDRWNIPNIDGQLTFLFGMKLANYSDDSVAQLVLQRKILGIIKEKVLQKNIDVAARSAANQMIRNGNPVDLMSLTDNINITQAILEAANITAKFDGHSGDNVRSSGYAFLNHHTRTLDSTSRQLIIDQIIGAGGYLYNVELYELKEEEKDWWETAFTGILGIFQIVAGVAMIGIGNVFGATFGVSLIAQGIGDLISVGAAIYTNTPIDFEDYIKSKGMAMGIALLTAGSLHFLNMVPGLGFIGNAANGVVNHLSKVGGLAFAGEIFAMQAASRVASALIYDVARKEISPEDIRSDVQGSIRDILEEFKYLLNGIIAIDKFNNNNVLKQALEQRIRGIVGRYQGRFQDDGTKFYKGLGGSFADAFGFGTLVRTTTDVTLGIIKNRQAIRKITNKIKEAIIEIGGNIDPFNILGVKLQREFGDAIGKQLAEAVDQYRLANTADSITCDKLNEIQVSNELAKYKQGVVQACGYIGGLFGQDYSLIYEAMGSNWVEIITQAIVSIQKQEIVKPTSDALGQHAVKLIGAMVQNIRDYKARKAAERASYQQDQEKMYRQKRDVEREVRDSGLIKENLEDRGKSGKEEKREQGSEYRVRKRDNMYKIAKKHGVSYQELITANPQIANPNLIYPDQVINIPIKGTINYSPTVTTDSGDMTGDKNLNNNPNRLDSKRDIKPTIIDNQGPNRFIDASGAAYLRGLADNDNRMYFESMENSGYVEFYSDDNENGFSARAFKKQADNGKIEVIIVYRGTDPLSINPKTWAPFLKDVKSGDADIAFNKIPEQQVDALAFAKRALEKAGSKNVDVTFTGHSLGAALAQLTAIKRGMGERVVVFDSPPIKGLVTENYDPTTITIYNSLPNLVNSAFGREHTVKPTIIYKTGAVCLGCVFAGSLEQHGIENFRNAYADDGSLKPDYREIKWPTNHMSQRTYHNIPEYRDYLYSQWLYQYRFDTFIQKPSYLMPAAGNFRAAYPTFESYIGKVVNKNQQKPK